jgi:hypothetical protein
MKAVGVSTGKINCALLINGSLAKIKEANPNTGKNSPFPNRQNQGMRVSSLKLMYWLKMGWT